MKNHFDLERKYRKAAEKDKKMNLYTNFCCYCDLVFFYIYECE